MPILASTDEEKAGFPHKKRTITCDRSFELKELSFTS